MPKYAEIKDNIITNVLIADADFIAQHKPNAIECPDFIGVGDKYDDGQFTRVVNPIIEQDDPETL